MAGLISPVCLKVSGSFSYQLMNALQAVISEILVFIAYIVNIIGLLLHD